MKPRTLKPFIDLPAVIRRFGRRVKQKGQEKAMQALIVRIVALLLAVGGVGGVLTQEEIEQVASFIAAAIGAGVLAWPLIKKVIAAFAAKKAL